MILDVPNAIDADKNLVLTNFARLESSDASSMPSVQTLKGRTIFTDNVECAQPIRLNCSCSQRDRGDALFWVDIDRI